MVSTKEIFSSVFLAVGGFLFGYDSGIITSTISLDTFKEYFTSPSDTVTGGIVSAFQGGAIAGTMVNMLFADRLGRKRTILVGSVISCVGCALQAGAVTMVMLMVGRFIAGLAVGMLTSTIPMYAAELSEPKWRATLSGLLQWTHDEARVILGRLRAKASPETIDLEFREIRDVILADRAAGNTSWKRILTKPSWRKRLILGCGVQAFGPLSGINVINYYGPRIYEILGIDNRTSLMIIGISGALSIVYCTLGLYLVDKVGRVKPLIVSAAILAAALLVYPAEIFPIEVRALGNALTTFTNWSVNLIFAQFTPHALSTVGFQYFYLFFGLNLIAMVCYYFFYPETKGRTLEQIDELFGDQLVPHAMVDPEGAAAAIEKEMM
ncbi:hypothetical protein FE257_002940 [Aspergillus nanangensis]|uniref:Major facilitator superfamily (MFS) profile domain-containing protein n=1 Tax=Aspergillus nanangensis TaxID=2582783 RepID=A0AAD4CSM1_ASPNN|nr:hypothetical protein FE257_002940 [Aspergillus nanangensis]